MELASPSAPSSFIPFDSNSSLSVLPSLSMPYTSVTLRLSIARPKLLCSLDARRKVVNICSRESSAQPAGPCAWVNSSMTLASFIASKLLNSLMYSRSALENWRSTTFPSEFIPMISAVLFVTGSVTKSPIFTSRLEMLSMFPAPSVIPSPRRPRAANASVPNCPTKFSLDLLTTLASSER